METGYLSPFTLLWACSVVTYYTHWPISVSPRKHFCITTTTQWNLEWAVCYRVDVMFIQSYVYGPTSWLCSCEHVILAT